MNFIPLLLVAVAVLPIFGLVIWVWLAVDRTESAMRSLLGFEGMHFEDSDTLPLR